MSTRERVIFNELPEDIEYRFVRNWSDPPEYSSLGKDQSKPFQPGHYFLELKLEEGTQVTASFNHYITVQNVTAEPGKDDSDIYIYKLIVPPIREDAVEGGDDDIEILEPEETEE